MNKKFFTLVGCLALGAAVSANAAYKDDYRTFATKSVSTTSKGNAKFSALENGKFNGVAWSQDVNYMQEGLLFQLQVKAGSAITEVDGDPYVLIQERNYQSGKIYLKAVKTSEAPLNASLWTIKYDKADGVSGGKFTYVNKETGFALTFDHKNTAIDLEVGVAKADTVTELMGCTDTWTWHSVNKLNKDADPFDFKPVYSYLHQQADDQVMCLLVADDTKTPVSRVKGYLATNGMVTSGADVAGYLLAPAVFKSEDAGTFLANVTNAVQLKPVVANPIIMTAADLNARMDADEPGSKNFQFKIVPDNLEGADVFVGDVVAEENTVVKCGLDEAKNLADVANSAFYLNFKIGDKYLMVDTARYQEEEYQPSVSPAVKFALNTPKTEDPNMMKARYCFKATYFPTNDSLLIEPLNAAVQSDEEWNAETPWKDSQACTGNTEGDKTGKNYFVNDYTKANTTVNDAPYVIDDENKSTTVSLTAATIPGVETPVITVAKDGRGEFKVRTSIVRPFDNLTRGTVADGLYFINVYTVKPSMARPNNAYIVKNMAGDMMYDVPAMDQDFSLMPATQWVVKQLGCNDASSKVRYVAIYNREYDNEKSTPVFFGQLYYLGDKEVNGETKSVYRFIDQTYENSYDSKGMFEKNELAVSDSIIFTEVTSPIAKTATHGYKSFTKDELNNGFENNYTIKYYNFNNDNLYLQSEVGQISVAKETTDPTMYEIAEATLPKGGGAIENPFGYPMADNVHKDLVRKAYVLKLKDANLIDNDKKYIALATGSDGKYYYQAVKKSDIDAGKAKMAYFYLKADQVRKDAKGAVQDTCYVLVDIKDIDETKDLYTDNGWNKANVVDGLGNLRFADLNDNPEDRSSAFYFQNEIRKQYIDVVEDYDLKLNSNVKIYRKSGNANEYLFEDMGDHKNVGLAQPIVKGLGYLGIEGKGVETDAAALYVDKVQKAKEYMPQYLFAVDIDSVPDGFVCSTLTHGYWINEADAKAADEKHYVAYNGYVAGRFLVNFNDSIGDGTNKFTNADKYKFDDFTRLGFLEGIHQVAADGKSEKLYILKSGTTLADVTTIKDNTKEGKKVVDFALLTDENSYVVELDGTHNNCAFSLRKINDKADETADASEGFLLETKGGDYSKIGSFEGAWVKIHNGVPVLAQATTEVGDHENTSEAGIIELINQAQVFYFGQTDEIATDVKDIEATEVKVIAGNGKVTIIGAQGKKVAINNVLGQTFANTVITSSEATIAVPAGIVFVNVEGEAAVKAIIK